MISTNAGLGFRQNNLALPADRNYFFIKLHFYNAFMDALWVGVF